MVATDMTRYAENDGQRPLLAMLSNEKVMLRFEQACGTRAGAVVVNIVNAANLNPEIYECEPSSVITAALNAATINLSLAPGLGQAAMLPFKKNKKVGNEWVTTKHAQLVIMVRGVKELAMRTNKYRVLNAFKVYEGQEVVEEQMTGRKTIQGKKISDTIIGYGAYLLLFSGYEATVYWPTEKVLAHAKRFSPTWNDREQKFNAKSRWVTDFDQSAEKTVIKDLIMNHGAISENDRAMLGMIDDERVDGAVLAKVEDEPDEGLKVATPAAPKRSEKKILEDLYGKDADSGEDDDPPYPYSAPEIVNVVSAAWGVDANVAFMGLENLHASGDLTEQLTVSEAALLRQPK